MPSNRPRQSRGFVVVHQTTRLPPLVCYAGAVQYALAARAVADAARGLRELRDVRAVVAAAVQTRRCTVEQLDAELTSGPIRGSALFRAALAEVAQGTRSGPEAELLELIKRGRLPTPLPGSSSARTFWPGRTRGGPMSRSRWRSTPRSGISHRRAGSRRCAGTAEWPPTGSWCSISRLVRSARSQPTYWPRFGPRSAAVAVSQLRRSERFARHEAGRMRRAPGNSLASAGRASPAVPAQSGFLYQHLLIKKSCARYVASYAGRARQRFSPRPRRP